jgi:GTP-binding protein
MIIRKAEFISSAVDPRQYPDTSLPEIAFAGRSNVGKSSLINLLMNRKNLAKVSSTPGKTRTVNFFDINGSFRIVDLPGYGYAKLSKAETERWGKMMESYLSGRENLIKVFQLVDIRHEPTAQDVQMYEWLKYYGLSGVVIATKSDKVSRNEMNRNKAVISRKLGLEAGDRIIPVSALKRSGTDDVLDLIEQLLAGEGDGPEAETAEENAQNS